MMVIEHNILFEEISGLVESGKLKFEGGDGLFQANAKGMFIQFVVPVNGPPNVSICEKVKNGGGKVLYEESGYRLNGFLWWIDGPSMKTKGSAQKAFVLLKKTFAGKSRTPRQADGA